MSEMDVIVLLVSEVRRIVSVCSDGSPSWRIYNGVDAWEVLLGYSTSQEVRALMFANDCVVYQQLVCRWSLLVSGVL